MQTVYEQSKLAERKASVKPKSNPVKHDAGKLRYDLLPFSALDQVVAVITLGEQKYPNPEQNWLDSATPETLERYKAAVGRHYSAAMQGEQYDPDMGSDHWANIATNCLFIMEMTKKIKHLADLEKEITDGTF